MEIKGHINKIISYASDTKPLVFKVKEDGVPELKTCTYLGFLPLREKDLIHCKGYLVDQEYQLVNRPLIMIPTDRDYLKTILFKSLARTKNITKIYHQLLDYIELDNNKEIFAKIDTWAVNKTTIDLDDLSKTKFNKLMSWWEYNICKRRLYLLGLTDTEIKTSRTNLNDLYTNLLENPYKVNNLPLEKSKEINRMVGRKCSKRDILSSQVLKEINNYFQSGWFATPLAVLEASYPDIKNNIEYLKKEYNIAFDDNLVYTKENYHIEVFLAEKINSYLIRNFDEKIRNSNMPDIPINYIKYEEEFKLTEQQDQALRGVLDNHISIITGGAGCGKTTLIKQIVKNLKHKKRNFILTSFTGKAVLKIKEVLGEDSEDFCFTLSRLIHKKMNRQEIPRFETLIIDEASMISNGLVYDFFSSFRHYYKLILIGDVNQLPPVTAGNFFSQLIKSEKIPTFYLTSNKRLLDGQDSNILKNANMILENNFSFKHTGNGFEIMEGDTEICKKIIRALKKKGMKDHKITVLTPYNKDIPALVKEHQNVYLKGKAAYSYMGNDYYIGDRLMQTKNIYNEDSEVMNGEEGIVEEITQDGIRVKYSELKNIFYKWKSEKDAYKGKQNDYDIEENLEREYLSTDLKHSFCKTVHKSQGSEYDYVIIYLPFSNSSFINKNLIYTAITRARKTVWLVCNKNNLISALGRKNNIVFEKLSQRIVSFDKS